MNSNKKYNAYKSSIYFLIANAVLLVAAIIVFVIFGFNFGTTIGGSKIFFESAMVIFLSLISIFVYVGLRHDWAKALTVVLVSLHNILLSLALVVLIRVPLSENIISGFVFVIALTSIFTIVLTKDNNENLKKADYSEIIKKKISQNGKFVAVISAIVAAIVFLNIIVLSKDIFSLARMLSIMLIVMIYAGFTVLLPTWCFFDSKIKKVKKVKTDDKVENQKVAKAVQTDDSL